VHAAEVQFKDPTVTVHYDVDPNEAVASMLPVLGDAAKQEYLVGGAHLSLPGLGHAHAEQNGFSCRQQPETDSNPQPSDR
jgi:hypothetical protein